MGRIILVVLFLLFIGKNLFCQDVLTLKNNYYLYNSSYQLPIASNLSLDKVNSDFNGFLVIEVDNTSKWDDSNHFFDVKMAFVSDLNDLINNTNLFDYTQTFSLFVDLLSDRYDNGNVTDLTSFMKFYKGFANANSDSLDIFLYRGNNEIKTNDLAKYKSFFILNGDIDRIHFIYKCRFNSAIISNKTNTGIKHILMPISYLKEFRETYDFEVFKYGFTKANITLKLE